MMMGFMTLPSRPSNAASGADLRVGLVACSLNAEHLRGMGRYVFELVRQSDAVGPVDWTLYGDDPRRPLRLPAAAHVRSHVFPYRGDRFHLWEQVGLPRQALRDGVDVLHCTEGTLPWWQPLPTVVTVHDTLAWDEFSGTRLEHLYLEQLQTAALHRSAAVVTISESSRRDILRKWPRLADRLTVIPHGIADDCFLEEPAEVPAALRPAIGTSPYVVYVGGPMPRKRFDWALKVLAEYPDPGVHLVACGFGSGAREATAAVLPQALGRRVHFAPFLEEGELRRLYRGASAVLYPTLYEGFGFPVVEAHAAGVPCIFSAVGSLAELVGPLSFIVPTHDLADWTRAAMRALGLGAHRAELAARGREWARRYSWERSCQAHLEVYRRVARRRTR
jgi:alpha-1,3-rhamnosyl/mannosyltransferase